MRIREYPMLYISKQIEPPASPQLGCGRGYPRPTMIARPHARRRGNWCAARPATTAVDRRAAGRCRRRSSLAFFCPWQLAVLAGWDVAALFVVGSVWTFIAVLDAADTQRVATREDDSHALVDLIMVVACLVSLVGVILGLAHARDHAGAVSSVLTGVAVFTVFLSWFTVHTLFVLRYARLYYSDVPGGIDFPNTDDPPDYMDFVYVVVHDRNDVSGVRHRYRCSSHPSNGDSPCAAVVRLRHSHRRRCHQRRR